MQRCCHRCGAEVGHVERVGRRDTCLGCGADLRCCLNCRHHDPARHNQCREPQAELQVDRERGNFCDLFDFRMGTTGARTQDPASAARARLEGLFAKKASG